MSLTLESPDFEAGGPIPSRFSCEGEDVSPSLRWSGVPGGTESLALIVDDPDAPNPAAPRVTWVHWVIYNLPPASGALPTGASPDGLPAGSAEGLNDWQRLGYGGPCPPIGRHRYFFKLYALDTELTGLRRPTKSSLEAAMEGHVLGRVELVGTYQKGDP